MLESTRRDFVNHTPSAETQEAMEVYREVVHALADAIELLPPCRERSLARTRLEESTFWAMAALARTAFDRRSNA